MRIAVIDMGTNTFNLLIAEYSDHSFHIMYSDKQAVKLGQRIAEQHFIDDEGIKRILTTLSQYKEKIKQYLVDEVIAIATSSIRTAKNQEQVVKLIRDRLDIDVKVINGEREAELIYIANQYAIRQCVKSEDVPVLIMDIGGGSTEFIIADGTSALWKKSFLIGMARLIDEIRPKDPVNLDDIHRIHSYLDNMLDSLKRQMSKYLPKVLVGSSGVFDSIVEMIDANVRPLTRNEKCCLIDKNDFSCIYHQILPLSYAERLKYKGLIEMRADMIVVSMILIDYVIQKYGVQKLVVSFYSLKEGVIVEKIMENKKD